MITPELTTPDGTSSSRGCLIARGHQWLYIGLWLPNVIMQCQGSVVNFPLPSEFALPVTVKCPPRPHNRHCSWTSYSGRYLG